MTMSATRTPQQRAQNRTLWLLSLAQIFSGIGTGAVVSTGALLAVELSGNDALAGSVTTTMTLGAAIASVLLMRLALVHGRRYTLTLGLGVAAAGAAGVIVAATTASFWLLIFSGALMGFGNAANLQARFAATDLSGKERRGRDLSLIVWMSTVGAVGGPNLIGVSGDFAKALGIPELSGLFIISLAGMFASMLVIWVGLRPDPYLVLVGRESLGCDKSAPTQADLQGGSPIAVERSSTEGPSLLAKAKPVAKPAPKPVAHPGLAVGIRALWHYPKARAALLGILSAHGVMVAVMSITPVHMTAHDATITLVGFTISLHIAGMYALSPLMGWLHDRIGGIATNLLGQSMLFVAALLAGFSGGAHVVTIIALTLLGLGWSAATVASSAMIVDAVPVTERVAAQGAADSLMSLAGALGGIVAGVALATIGYLGLGVASALVCAVILAAIAAIARRL